MQLGPKTGGPRRGSAPCANPVTHVVDQNVDPTVLLEDGAREGIDLVGLADVGDDHAGGAALTSDRGGCLLGHRLIDLAR